MTQLYSPFPAGCFGNGSLSSYVHLTLFPYYSAISIYISQSVTEQKSVFT